MTPYNIPSAQAAEGLLSSVTRKFRFGLKKNLRRLPPWEQVAAAAAAPVHRMPPVTLEQPRPDSDDVITS